MNWNKNISIEEDYTKTEVLYNGVSIARYFKSGHISLGIENLHGNIGNTSLHDFIDCLIELQNYMENKNGLKRIT